MSNKLTNTKKCNYKFDPNSIYEFKIDFYKIGCFAGEGFYDYGKIEYYKDNLYKFYCYYRLNDENSTWKKCNGDFRLIEYLGTCASKDLVFKPPPLIGIRKGQVDLMYMEVINNKIRQIEIDN